MCVKSCPTLLCFTQKIMHVWMSLNSTSLDPGTHVNYIQLIQFWLFWSGFPALQSGHVRSTPCIPSLHTSYVNRKEGIMGAANYAQKFAGFRLWQVQQGGTIHWRGFILSSQIIWISSMYFLPISWKWICPDLNFQSRSKLFLQSASEPLLLFGLVNIHQSIC